ncbi:glycosyltransferase family 9 protein [Paraburkholderia kirstenboschensis]|uniref:Glycosyltransferase family 9 protein n=1 Tax=Paraburkholderia kirstenboschensis TaxID=1245436 RepID=A0ABZ0EL84_9BURK|nr:glycosyltransferase family 9 protein [Paraburkholderia kirstenboschensis]WOD17921.1 glycosyltransferase family 9 protein [Paraburkholderia kirstenboschensis]
MKINLGCGSDYMQGWLNVDQWPDANPDLVMNLEETPWKLDDNCADEILLKHVLEHVGQSSSTFLAIFQEIYRICKPDAIVNIQVPHPRHQDFLSDPTHIRPILPELFSCFDLATVELWQEHNLPGTPLAKYLKVDFEVARVQYHLSAHWQKEHAEGRIDEAGLMHAIDTFNNVVEWIDIGLRVRKPFRPGHALRKVDAICIERHGGMGDVLMALGAAKALKAISDRPIVMVTAPSFRSLAEACPHVDEVVDNVSALNGRYVNVKHIDLNPTAYGTSRLHQIDAYLQAFGVSADAALKDIELRLEASGEADAQRLIASWPARAPGQVRTLLHVGQGDPNRTWPVQRWAELATALIGQGQQVILIGSGDKLREQSAMTAVEGVLSALNVLGAEGTVALMRQSDVLVSADSGPVQLAAASDIGIVALFSAVAGSCRLPFRRGEARWRAEEVKPSCGFYPCYRQMQDPQIMAPFHAALQNQSLSVGKLFSDWCPAGSSFACMTQQISVPMVLDAVKRIALSVDSSNTDATPPKTRTRRALDAVAASPKRRPRKRKASTVATETVTASGSGRVEGA